MFKIFRRLITNSFFNFFWLFFFFNDTATTEIYTLSLHDALPISPARRPAPPLQPARTDRVRAPLPRSEEHTSELQSRQYLVCRLLLEKKKTARGPFAWTFDWWPRPIGT